MADRETKERKLMALMVNDLGPGFGEREMARLEEEVRSISDAELDGTLAGRLELPLLQTKRRWSGPSPMSRSSPGVIRRASPAPPT